MCKGTEAGKSVCSGNRESWVLDGGLRTQTEAKGGDGLWVFAKES